jgi:uncharacterized protein
VKKVVKSILIGMTMASKIYAYAPPVTNIGRSSMATFTAPPSITFLARREDRIYFNSVLLLGKSDKDDTDNDNDDDDDDSENAVAMGPAATNVLGTTLCSCCSNVGGNSGIGTGYYRNGYCSTGQDDVGRHTVCVQVTEDFLTFSKAVGNDLSTKMPQYLFPGLKDGDIWCLCAERWVQAYEAGMAPKLFLKATHEKTLDYVSFDVLRQYAIDKHEADTIITTLNEQRDRLNKLI